MTCPASGFELWGLGSGVWGSGFGVWGLESGVWGFGCRVWGRGFKGWDQPASVNSPPRRCGYGDIEIEKLSEKFLLL